MSSFVVSAMVIKWWGLFLFSPWVAFRIIQIHFREDHLLHKKWYSHTFVLIPAFTLITNLYKPQLIATSWCTYSRHSGKCRESISEVKADEQNGSTLPKYLTHPQKQTNLSSNLANEFLSQLRTCRCPGLWWGKMRQRQGTLRSTRTQTVRGCTQRLPPQSYPDHQAGVTRTRKVHPHPPRFLSMRSSSPWHPA